LSIKARGCQIVFRFLIIALVASVLLLISKASLFQPSASAQIPRQSMPSNPCSALAPRDFAAIPDAPPPFLMIGLIGLEMIYFSIGNLEKL
jgi:hypothetical protein